MMEKATAFSAASRSNPLFLRLDGRGDSVKARDARTGIRIDCLSYAAGGLRRHIDHLHPIVPINCIGSLNGITAAGPDAETNDDRVGGCASDGFDLGRLTAGSWVG